MTGWREHPLWGPALSLVISFGLLLVIVLFDSGAQDQLIFENLAVPLIRIVFLVSLGLVIGEVIERTGWTRYLAILAGPIFRFSRLGPRCSAAFSTAFFSGVTANGLLLNFYEDGSINKQQLFLTNFINQLPAFFLHLPTTIFIILPLAGWAGGIYLLLVFLAILFRTAIFVLYGHFRVNPVQIDPLEVQDQTEGQKFHWREILRQVKRKVPKRLLKIIQFVLPIYLFVFMLNVTGFFQLIQEGLSDYAINTFIPLESLSMVIISFLADYTSGFATAGALLQSKVLTFKQAILALVIGNLIAIPIRSLRHQLPRYLGVFRPKLGTQLLALGQGFRALSLMLVGGLYYLLG